MKITDLFTPLLEECLNRNSAPGQNLGSDFAETLKKSHSEERLLPVLGTQGMGKSTLINALLGIYATNIYNHLFLGFPFSMSNINLST